MKPGIKAIIAGGVIFIFGTLVVPLLFILPFMFEKSSEVQFKAPGTCETSVEKPGRYYLWNDFRAVYHGKSYNRSKSLPDGMEIKIQNSDGSLLQFVSDTSISSNSNGSSKNSIGYVEIKAPSKIKVEVSGGDEDRILSLEQFNLSKMFGFMIAGFGVSALVTIGGIGIGIWGILRLVKSNQTTRGRT